MQLKIIFIIHDYFFKLTKGEIKVILKQKWLINKVIKGKIRFLENNERGRNKLQLENVGELQSVAIAAIILKEGNFFY